MRLLLIVPVGLVGDPLHADCFHLVLVEGLSGTPAVVVGRGWPWLEKEN